MEKKLVRMKLADLVPYDNNPRRNEEAVEATIASMQQCGNIDPIEVDENRVILSGHTRRLALLKMGYEESDVVVVTGLTDVQKKKYRLLANKTNEFAGWDIDKLDDIAPEDDEDGGTEVAEINAEAIKRAEELAQIVIKERTRGDIFEDLYRDLLGNSLRAVV